MVQANERSKESNTKCCFICGERQALWLLNSKVNIENNPFFPFLQYQKTPVNAGGLDANGRCLSCNVCYLFLMQQWKVYELNRTPLLKRLYWLKRPADEYLDLDDNANKESVKDKSRSCDVVAFQSSRKTNIPPMNCDDIGLQLCQVCYSKKEKAFMKSVFIVPQKSVDIAFYPGIVKETEAIDGCISVCVTCESKLLKKWFDYEQDKVPLTERNYCISMLGPTDIKPKAVACYLCEDTLSCERSHVLFCKDVEHGPYYPFLKNLSVPRNGLSVNVKGFTFGCGDCKSFLKKQWDVFDDSEVPQEERVYCINISQPPLLPSSFDSAAKIACFICSGKNEVCKLKRIYCNPGANMNLGFLKSFPKNKDGFFCDDTGETFVCHSCFEELKQHWNKYRSNIFEQVETDTNISRTPYTCEICSKHKGNESKLHIMPVEKEGEVTPYFPILRRLRSENNLTPISSCQLCSLNLMKQWLKYKQNKAIDASHPEYRYDKFICYVCDSLISHQDIHLANYENIKKDVKVEANPFAIMIESDVVVCRKCRQECFVYVQTEHIETSTSYKLEEENLVKQQEAGMKATATVPPFLNFSMRNHPRELSTATPTSAEGSFAAALRKLAQQAPGFPSPITHRELRQSPPSKNGEAISSMLLPHHSAHPGSHINGTPSIMTPVHHTYPISEKTELMMKSPYGHSHEAHKELSSRPPLPGMFQFHERDEHSRHRSKERYEPHGRKPFEQTYHNSASSAGVILNNSLKERPSSSIGLVHPQPVRKHREEEPNPGVMNSILYNHRESGMRPLSPTEIQRYAPFVARHHSQGSQSSCPVHGHEPGHQHDERGCRPPPLSFDPAHLPREFSLHAQHPRLREEIQLMQQHGRHPMERKEILQSHHALEEDLRRRGLDYRWAVPPHLLDEQYRRHLLNGGHEHSGFKEPPHGLYFPHLHYGRDYPVPTDQYLPHGLPSQSELLHRHVPPISPRLLDYYRRGEHGLSERSRNDVEADRRFDERREKERGNLRRAPSMESLRRKSEEIMIAERNKNIQAMERENHEMFDSRPKLPFIKGLDYKHKIQKCNDKPNDANSIHTLLSSKLPDAKTELAAASILANMNRINQSPCSDEVESLTSSSGGENQPMKSFPLKLEETENVIETEQSEQKLEYMMSLGLVSHSRKRVLEDDYDRKRWDRKFRKFRGRPKKRSKRENTEESSLNGDTRPGSDLDFYSGPMTRHKQQLLQEQENLLEQIQKRNSTDTNEENLHNNSDSNNNSEQAVEKNHKDRRSPRNSPNKESRTPDTFAAEKRRHLLAENINSSTSSSKHTTSSNQDVSHSFITNHAHAHVADSKHNLEQSRLVAMLRDNNSLTQNLNKHERNIQRPHSHQRHDPVEEAKMLDNSMFGRLNEQHESYVRWSGVQHVSQAYVAYQAEYDLKRQQLLQSYEELQRKSHCLHQKKDCLEKDMLVYNERRMRIAEKRRHMHIAMEGIHQSLRTLSNL